MNDDIRLLAKWIENTDNAVALTGAGISTKSGIPDFRSDKGIYTEKIDYEKMLSIDYFNRFPDEFYRFFKAKMIYPNAQPNDAHRLLARLEDKHIKAVITQNIDRLHTAAGSKNVIEVHGNLFEYTCTECGNKITLEKVMEKDGTPRCKCGGVYRPDIVFYGQQLNEDNIERSIAYMRSADLVICIGTSLVVYPVAGFLRYMRNDARLVIVNHDPTPFDEYADLIIRDDIVEVSHELERILF